MAVINPKGHTMKKIIATMLLSTISLFATQYTAQIVKVVDGDTLHVRINGSFEKVRLLYIDTPEKFGGAKLMKDSMRSGISASDEQDLGYLSSSYALRFFNPGDTVVINSDGKDHYGRMLGTVNKYGVEYSKQVIVDGYACIYKRAPYPKDLDTALARAKADKKGLWGIDYETMNKLCK